MRGVFESIFTVLLVLKLTGIVAWSWWIITAPLWGVPLVTLPIVIIAMKRQNKRNLRW